MCQFHKVLEFVDLGLEVIYVICEDSQVVYVCRGGACALGGVEAITK